MKISFDFDGTLTQGWVMKLARTLIAQGEEVHITTARSSNESTAVFVTADLLGIPHKNCTFTEYQDKVNFLGDFDIHFDDDDYEIDLINRAEGRCKGLLVGFTNWRADVAKMMD